MKKLVCIILALLIIFSAVSCKSIDDVVENSPEIDTDVENKTENKDGDESDAEDTEELSKATDGNLNNGDLNNNDNSNNDNSNDDVKVEESEQHTHQYEKVVTEPTEDSEGYTTNTSRAETVI
jgi:hypothetical protein